MNSKRNLLSFYGTHQKQEECSVGKEKTIYLNPRDNTTGDWDCISSYGVTHNCNWILKLSFSNVSMEASSTDAPVP
jgi:hypothetical protein